MPDDEKDKKITELALKIHTISDQCNQAENSSEGLSKDNVMLLRMVHILAEALQRLEGKSRTAKEALYVFDALWKYSGRNQPYRSRVKEPELPPRKMNI